MKINSPGSVCGIEIQVFTLKGQSLPNSKQAKPIKFLKNHKIPWAGRDSRGSRALVWCGTQKCSSRVFLCLWMAGGTSSPALSCTSHQEIRSTRLVTLQSKWFLKFFLNVGLWCSQMPAAGAVLQGRALRLFGSFLLLAEGMGKPESPRNKCFQRWFNWVKGDRWTEQSHEKLSWGNADSHLYLHYPLT